VLGLGDYRTVCQAKISEREVEEERRRGWKRLKEDGQKEEGLKEKGLRKEGLKEEGLREEGVKEEGQKEEGLKEMRQEDPRVNGVAEERQWMPSPSWIH
jgi:hypothetical protein